MQESISNERVNKLKKYYLVKIDYNLGNYQFHILKDEYIGGSSVRILTYDGDRTWRHIANYFFPTPNLKTAIIERGTLWKWTLLSESDNLEELEILKNQEYEKYLTMRELIN